MQPRHALTWIEENVVGKITKQKLDQQRKKETDQLDMMQTASIIYHPESLIEMQMVCLALLWVAQEFWVLTDNMDESLAS